MCYSFGGQKSKPSLAGLRGQGVGKAGPFWMLSERSVSGLFHLPEAGCLHPLACGSSSASLEFSLLSPHPLRLNLLLPPLLSGYISFPDGSMVKEPGFDPGVWKVLWRREWLLTPIFWPEEFHGLYSPWGCKEWDRTEQLS